MCSFRKYGFFYYYNTHVLCLVVAFRSLEQAIQDLDRQQDEDRRARGGVASTFGVDSPFAMTTTPPSHASRPAARLGLFAIAAADDDEDADEDAEDDEDDDKPHAAAAYHDPRRAPRRATAASAAAADDDSDDD